MYDLFERLDHGPEVSGVKPLRLHLVGRSRIRTGDDRVRFSVAGPTVLVERIGHRDRLYEEHR
jgi:mRNA-degrading endonuclease RelE of RelBE toxin-antitoxin system